LLQAASLLDLGQQIELTGQIYEAHQMPLETDKDNTFNFKDTSQGLNLDFMTYSMYSMASKDPTALLNSTYMTNAAQKTFSTFFQHFVSSGHSIANTSQAYQPFNAHLPPDLGSVMGPGGLSGSQIHFDPAPPQDHTPSPGLPTHRTAVASVSTRVELLRMDSIAVGLSLGILLGLVGTLVVLAVVQRKYWRNLITSAECLADVLALVARSDRFLDFVQNLGPNGLKRLPHLMTTLELFVDDNGEKRWRVQLKGVEGSDGTMS
jgi:hypothetical protein